MAQEGGIAVVYWGPHSVSTEMFARYLHATCYLIHYLGWKRPWQAPFKYPLMWLKTWWVLLKQRPSAVLVINTPIFAPLCAYVYCLTARIPFAMNIHGTTLGGRKWGWALPLQWFLAKKAVVSLVGTAEYQRIFESWGAPVLFLSDAPVAIPTTDHDSNWPQNGFNITVVSTFAGDEPLDLVVEAARCLPNVCFHITGDKKLANSNLLSSAPSNVEFPGYLKGQAYWNRLSSSQAIMTLTTNPSSLVMGGVEGMYMGKPLILSRQPALLGYFTKGAVFIDHTVESIVEGVRHSRECANALSRESAELAVEKRSHWEISFRGFAEIMGAAYE